LKSLRKETDGRCSLLGFVGAPLTLAAYIINGESDKDCLEAKLMMYNNEQMMRELLEKLSLNLASYACHQVCVCVFKSLKKKN
jgi:uroporphyrinogen decarboxylase